MTYADQLREEGRQESRRELLERSRARMLHLLQIKFGTINVQVIQRVQAAGEEQLDAWLERLLSAATAEEVLRTPEHLDGRR